MPVLRLERWEIVDHRLAGGVGSDSVSDSRVTKRGMRRGTVPSLSAGERFGLIVCPRSIEPSRQINVGDRGKRCELETTSRCTHVRTCHVIVHSSNLCLRVWTHVVLECSSSCSPEMISTTGPGSLNFKLKRS